VPKVSNYKRAKTDATKAAYTSHGEGRAASDAEAATVVEATKNLADATSSLSEGQRRLLSEGFLGLKKVAGMWLLMLGLRGRGWVRPRQA